MQPPIATKDPPRRRRWLRMVGFTGRKSTPVLDLSAKLRERRLADAAERRTPRRDPAA